MSGYGGKPLQFQFQKKEYKKFNPPPVNSEKSKFGYSTMTSIHNTALQTQLAMTKKRTYDEEDYFNDEPASYSEEPGYQPAPGSPGTAGVSGEVDDSDEEDPLDAFMQGIEKEVKQQTKGGKAKAAVPSATAEPESAAPTKGSGKGNKGIRDDIEQEDDEESFYRFLEENPQAGRFGEDDDEEVEYDADGNPVVTHKRYIDPLPPIDHSQIDYPPFEKNFYTETEDIASLTNQQVQELRGKLGIKVYGAAPPKPVTSFAHFGLDEGLMKTIRRSEYTQPTPIQAQGIPIALRGRDIIGIAKTGSGKTAAFIIPMITHIMDQPQLQRGDGPIGLILAPTRELSLQAREKSKDISPEAENLDQSRPNVLQGKRAGGGLIYNEAKRYGKAYGIRVVVCYGGGNKWEQGKALEEGAEIVVATPGRMIDHIKGKSTNLQRVTILVLDEADRMFDMGFEPQVRSICDHVRPERQCLMFSATFKKRIERLARDVLTDAIKVVQGDLGEANTDIQQIVKFMDAPNSKWNWLIANIVELTATGSVLIFVTKKINAEELANNLKLRDVEPLLLHGDMNQVDRNEVISKFRKKESNVLVATDVAARGLDIPHIRTVINYDVARDIDTHTHRIGRTGRAGEKGTAVTLITSKDKDFAGHLVRNLEAAGQEVSKELMSLAMQNQWFRKSRFRNSEGRKPNVGGHGLGYKETGGGSSTAASSSSSFAYGGNKSKSSGDEESAVNTASAVPEESSGEAEAIPRPAVGPAGTGRLSALRDAFKAQYMANFQSASSVETGKMDPSKQKYLPPPVQPSPGTATATSSSKDGERSRKRSRWDS